MKITKLDIGMIVGAVIAGIIVSIIILSQIKHGFEHIEEQINPEVTPVEQTDKFVPRAEAKSSSPVSIEDETKDDIELISGEASYYNRTICPLHNTTYGVDCFMKNQKLFDDQAMTSACPIELLGKNIEVSNGTDSIIVKCTDTGSYGEKYGRILDLSEGAFSKLAPTSRGTVEVTYKEVS